MERRHAVSTHASEKACVAYDTSQLEDDDMYSSSEDEDENDQDGSEKVVVRTTPTPQSPRVSALPEEDAPLGFSCYVLVAMEPLEPQVSESSWDGRI